jgi:small subunit ribosomal protein S21
MSARQAGQRFRVPAGRFLIVISIPLIIHPPTQPVSDRRIRMLAVQVKKGEPIDRALKRLKSKMEVEGKLDEVRRLRSHETPSARSKRKARIAAKKNRYKFRFIAE